MRVKMDKMIHSFLFSPGTIVNHGLGSRKIRPVLKHAASYSVLSPNFIADPNFKHRHTIDFMLKTKAFNERYILDESPEVRNLRFTNPPFHLSRTSSGLSISICSKLSGLQGARYNSTTVVRYKGLTIRFFSGQSPWNARGFHHGHQFNSCYIWCIPALTDPLAAAMV